MQLTGIDEAVGRCCLSGLQVLIKQLTSGGGGKPSFPSPSAGDLRELPWVPLRGEGSCGGETRNSSGSQAGPSIWAVCKEVWSMGAALGTEGIPT